MKKREKGNVEEEKTFPHNAKKSRNLFFTNPSKIGHSRKNYVNIVLIKADQGSHCLPSSTPQCLRMLYAVVT